MKNNRERWQFYADPADAKTVLSPPEARYWKKQVKHLAKVGIEFEFNLPEKKGGQCKGDNLYCPCVHLDEGCWTECANLKKCRKAKPSYELCGNRQKECKAEDCEGCKDYVFSCLGVVCADFVSACFSCKRYEKSCETCPNKYQADRDPKQIRQILSQILAPSKNYGRVGPCGVVDIKTDGSLKGDKGAEIITVGRRVDYWEFYSMSKKIIDEAVRRGAYLDERTGSHMHVLTSYYPKQGANELEKPMPAIILANFHQLVRRYQNALTWMTMALDHPNHMTRWEKFRVSVLDISPVIRGMREMVNDVAQNSDGNKYGFINYNSIRFAGEDLETFHVEFRQADSTLCPSFYAAIACLHYAFVIKAVEISRYGLLKIGDEAWMKKAQEMKECILNGRGDYGGSRVGNTSKVLNHADYFISESLDLVKQMKSILLKLSPAYDVLLKIAQRPVALRRIDGQKWSEIEDELKIEMSNASKLESKIGEIIDLNIIDECHNIDEWTTEVQKCLSEDNNFEMEVSINDVKNVIEVKTREGELVWSESLGTMIAVE